MKRYICRRNHRTLKPNDFKGLCLDSPDLPFVQNNYCTNCNCLFDKVSEKIRFAKITHQWYIFCGDDCWSIWCQSFNK